MPAGHEHENHDDHEAQADHETQINQDAPDMDALMMAVTGAPLSDEARADPVFLAAHRAAAADVALLREQLGLLADALTEPVGRTAPEPAPVRPVRAARRRLLPLTLRAVGVAAAGALVLGGGWLVVQAGQGVGIDASSKSADDGAAADEKAESSAAGSPLGDPAYLACEARLVVEGDVTDVERVPGTAQERVTLRVTRSYKPERPTTTEVGFVMEEGMDPLLAEGDHVLVGLAKGSASPDVWAVGAADIAAERAAIARAAPSLDGVTCE
ncbi:hypothetical protein [Streptomyces sp. NPDC006527]|uniref:hypothetical protein n=1 Tax=Streptomyces sp. NPDC006527 TaxID=3364749 RepID=UPI0036B68536